MISIRVCTRVALIPVLLAAASLPCGAQTKSQSPEPPAVHQAPVIVNGQTLFSVPGVLSFPAEARAAAISRRIAEISKDISFNPDSLSLTETPSYTDIAATDLVVMSVTDQDAALAGRTRQQLAQDLSGRIRSAVIARRKEYSVKSLLLGVLYALLATVTLILILRLLQFLFRKVYRTLERWRGTHIRTIKIQRFELLPADRITNLLIGVARLLRLALTLLLLSVYISLVLNFFPWTRGYGTILFGYIIAPITAVGQAVVSYLPNIFFMAVIMAVAFYVSKFVKLVFREIERGNLEFSGFYPEWAAPTYKIVRFLIFALTAVVIFPYLPGARSPAFQGISIFLGLLLSLGSTSAVANVIAGVILTYMRAFTVGDRVKIADTMGDVIEKTLLVTRVRTIKNVEITIANSMVLGAHIINFSASNLESGLILHTSVTIGYDAPWRKVHELLLSAAQATEHILKDPAPFVLQTALDDFYVHYEINAYTDQPRMMANIYSDLHQNIQDKFNEGGVEIMSSHYSSLRDGNQTTIPEDYLPADYESPGFRFDKRDANVHREVGKPRAPEAKTHEEG
jgi:small-conductance mechanosensitive channel